MAEIDKGLPNVRRSVTIPSQEELTEVTTGLQESVPRTRIQRLLKTKMAR